jgi:CTP:molybdopterin cytidylyltransferase MocA
MTVHLDHLMVPSLRMMASAKLLAELLGGTLVGNECRAVRLPRNFMHRIVVRRYKATGRFVIGKINLSCVQAPMKSATP